MKGVLLTVAVALLIPGALMAATPVVGVYFNGVLHYDPVAMDLFEGHVFILTDEYWVTGFEYALYTPNDPLQDNIAISKIVYPDNYQVSLGEPFSGHAITYWPPLTATTSTGVELLVTFTFVTFEDCVDMPDYPIVMGPSPGSGKLQIAYYPNNEELEINGLTSTLCVVETATEEGSWGAIKSLYR